MEVHLPQELEVFVGRQVASGAYASAEELLVDALERLRAQQDADNEAIRRGIAQAESGMGRPVEEVFEELLGELHAKHPELEG